MSRHQRNESVLADMKDNDQQNADGEARHDISIDDRHLVERSDQCRHLPSGIKCADRAHCSQQCRYDSRPECQEKGSLDHIRQLGSREQRHVILHGEAADRSDLCGAREAVHSQDQDRQINKHEHEQQKCTF